MKKICRQCQNEKLNIEFSKRTRSSDGLNLYCRECEAINKKKVRNGVYESKKLINTLKVDYFKTIDTCEKAYLYGLIAADGCIMEIQNKTFPSYKFALQLAKKDEELIDLLISAITPLNKKLYDKSGNTERCSLKFVNTEFCKHLIDKGIIPRKTGQFRFPFEHLADREDLHYSFLLGYFDGDGCYSTRFSLASGDKQFLEDVQEYFNIDQSIYSLTNPHGSCFELTIPKKVMVKAFEMFKHSLNRKRINFSKI